MTRSLCEVKAYINSAHPSISTSHLHRLPTRRHTTLSSRPLLLPDARKDRTSSTYLYDQPFLPAAILSCRLRLPAEKAQSARCQAIRLAKGHRASRRICSNRYNCPSYCILCYIVAATYSSPPGHVPSLLMDVKPSPGGIPTQEARCSVSPELKAGP